MTLSIHALQLGMLPTNAYLICDSETSDAVLVDPVDEADIILETATLNGATIRLIIATHAHFDHVLASAPLKEQTGAVFAAHADAAAELPSMPQRGRFYFGRDFPAAAIPDRLLTTASEVLSVGGIRLRTLYTPGHAPGHLSLLLEDEGIVFSGDALFSGSIGRTDLPGGDHEQLLSSIQAQLLTLPDETIVLPGHGEATTIGRERATNPFLQGL